MLFLTAVLGIIAFVALIAALTAYHVLPTGRICAHCGIPTEAVHLRRGFSWAERWFHWRWCSRCGWEGLGRRIGNRNLSAETADEMGGFRWSEHTSAEVPIFYWKPDETQDPPHTTPRTSEFRWDDAEVPPPEVDQPDSEGRRRRWGLGGAPERRPEGYRHRDHP